MIAIDMHVHPGTKEYLVDSGGKYLKDALKYFHKEDVIVSLEEMARYYREVDMLGVLLAWDTETQTGLPPVTNDYVAAAVEKYPESFIGFASVDPWKGRIAVDELTRAVKVLGLRGLKLHPICQAFYLNDRRFYPLWETCSALKIPLLVHTGTTGVGAGVPGGNGLKLKYARPIPSIDDVAADFPDLTIIGAHPSWPWQEEMLALAVHKTNVYIDLSGWSPKYFPPSLVRYANTLLQDRVLFGSDYPFLTPERWLADFEKAGFKPEVRQKILLDNAKRLLKL
ncbi:amidohydrolase 2 [hydrothermal vent metagenome]|uniref:Amidohydrolase 2 n=1 Tax=hydrothermal vent metagenome TaxID=652676 RepID=A0A3B1CXF0_9ZZZZ|nr:amidohydrolase [Candidatus Manganitrophaceae bacterium]